MTQHTQATRNLVSALWMQTEPRLSSAEIGRRLNLSKNAVVGLASRMNLPPRLSPIIRTDAPRQSHQPRPRAPKTTLPGVGDGNVPEPAVRAPEVVIRRGPVQACCWPEGEPGKLGFGFCGARAVAAKPYCPVHCEVAYVRVEREAA